MNRNRVTVAVFLSPLIAVSLAGHAYGGGQANGSDGISSEGSGAGITVTGQSSVELSAPSSAADSSGGQVYRDGGTVCESGTLAQVAAQEDAGGEQNSTAWNCLRDLPRVTEADSVVVTATDVSRLMVEGSGLWRQPPGPEARVDIIVIAYTSPDSLTLSTAVAGVPVPVTATPVTGTITTHPGG